MEAFFTSWQLWVKLVFLLGCGIIATVAAGLAKVTVSHYRLKGYITQTQVDEAMMKADVNPWLGSEDTQTDSVPFGSTALQQGIEVEGVWASLPNTPDTSTERLHDRELPCSSNPATTFLPCIDITKEHDERPFVDQVSTMSASSIPEPHAEKDTVEAKTYDAELCHTEPMDGPYSLFMLQHPDFARAIGEIEIEYRASEQKNHSASAHPEDRPSFVKHSNNRFNHVNNTSFAKLPPTRRHSDDLSMLDRQRRSQVAETGQITPRVRRPGSVKAATQIVDKAGQPTNQQHPCSIVGTAAQ